MRTTLVNKLILSGVMSLMVLASCSNPGSTSTSTSATYNRTPIAGSGVVVFRDIDGGFYGILSDSSSNQFVPVNLPSNLQTDGLHVRFQGTVAAIAETAHNWGTAVRIENIDEIN